jgi:hypothetical protein
MPCNGKAQPETPSLVSRQPKRTIAQALYIDTTHSTVCADSHERQVTAVTQINHMLPGGVE